MAEEFALEERFREAAAGDLDEAAGAALADGMDLAGEERLARPAFSGDEDRDPRVGNPAGDGRIDSSAPRIATGAASGVGGRAGTATASNLGARQARSRASRSRSSAAGKPRVTSQPDASA
jgi:hypothetical protein